MSCGIRLCTYNIWSKRFFAKPTIFLRFQDTVFVLEQLYLLFHCFELASFFISIIFRVQVFLFFLMCDGLMMINPLIFWFLLEQIIKEMLFRHFRQCQGMFISPLRGIFQPIDGIYFLEIELITHSSIYEMLYKLIFLHLYFQTHLKIRVNGRQKLFHKSQIILILMETYKKRSQNETEIIQHIKFIAKDLFQPASPQKYNNFIGLYKGGKGSASKQFVRTRKQEGKYKEIIEYQITQSRGIIPTTLSLSKRKSKKKSIFGNFDDFWSNCANQHPKKEMTPIMQQINKNIYSRFKTESNAPAEISQAILYPSQRQQHWQQFLKRSQIWNKERKDNLRQSKMREITRQSPQLRKRINTTANQNCKEAITDKQMSDVQISIAKLRYQTEKLRLKLQKINGNQHKKENYKKSYNNY